MVVMELKQEEWERIQGLGDLKKKLEGSYGKTIVLPQGTMAIYITTDPEYLKRRKENGIKGEMIELLQKNNHNPVSVFGLLPDI